MNLSKCERCDSYNEMPVLGEEIVTVQFSANASHPEDFHLQHNIIQAWVSAMGNSKTDILMFPLVVCFFASLLGTPLVLLAIFSNNNLRQETRYLLLANTLVNDLIYSILNTFIDILNAAGVGMPKVVCETLLYALTVAYCNGILTVTAMVVDTYVAIGWPLRYTSLLPHTRTLKIIICIWIISAVIPSVIYIITLGTQQNPFSTLSIWTALQELHLISYLTGLWITLSMANMLMMLPKAVSPYVYALRYREVTKTIRSLSMLRHIRRVHPTG
ncbi:uncharacterized protein LOC144487697 [Mustelus asterias]